jgi:mannose-6-phosphate isomerase-like protein (cupin superfamily)
MFQPDVTFLAGKVLKRSLPVLAAGDQPPVARLKRLLLPQGELAQFYDGEEGIRYIAFLALRAGVARGNHYHKFKEELLYLIDGEVLLVLENIDSKLRESVLLQTGDLAYIPAGVAHALRALKDGQAVECSPGRYDATDSYRYPLE